MFHVINIFDAATQEQAFWNSGFNEELKYENKDSQEQTQD